MLFGLGYATLTSLPFNARLMFWATIDMIRGKLGLSPIFIKAIGHPGEFAFLNTPSSYPGMSASTFLSLKILKQEPLRFHFNVCTRGYILSQCS